MDSFRANDYRTMARFYRELATGRDFFAKQERVLCSIFEKYGIGKEKRILDASCGTGDVLSLLKKRGFHNTLGSDGSAAMLAHVTDQSIPIHRCSWQNLNTLFKSFGRTDVVFMLGNSLAHANKNDLALIAGHAHNGLNDLGVFIFDFRLWDATPSGLRENKRVESVWRNLGTVNIEEKKWNVEDSVEYLVEISECRQKVSYRFTSDDVPDKCVTEEVSYSVWDEMWARASLRAAGFSPEKTAILNLTEELGWPYLVAVARK